MLDEGEGSNVWWHPWAPVVHRIVEKEWERRGMAA
jgi:hypothetical protein